MKKRIIWSVSLVLLFAAACSTTGGVSEPDPAPPETEADTAVVESESTETEPAAETNEDDTADTTDTSVVHDPNERFSADKYDEYEIVTLLPRDAIPAIDNPQFVSAEAANEAYDPDELVIGVEFNGEARAYSVPFLSSHEIVNDTVGGVKIAVTW